MERLEQLPGAMQNLAQATRSQVTLNEKLQGLLVGLSEPNQDLTHALQDCASESQRQTDLLRDIRSRLAEQQDNEKDATVAMSRLPELLESISRSNASHIELMEQMRDRWSNDKDDLAEEMVHFGRKISVLMVVVIFLLALLTAAAALQIFIGK
jgi:hypothetical protein